MKTAMQELRDDLIQIFHDNKIPLYLDIGKYLEKEKQQIIEAYEDGKQNGMDSITNIHMYIIGEKYYNQTYNQTNVGNDGFEFDNSSTIPPPKTNNL
jgi:hypothetical protein